MSTAARWLLALAPIALSSAQAATFTVTSAHNSGPNTLRWAIEAANATAAADIIAFNVAGLGVREIFLSTALPSLIHPVTIDGTTQPGWTHSPIIRVDGQNDPDVWYGFDLEANGSVIRGLQIVRIAGPGIRIWGADCVVASSYIGTDGNGDLGNAGDGIYVEGDSFVVGGASAGAGNTISGNEGSGIRAIDGSVGGKIWGNRIGTSSTGQAAIPNGNDGVSLWSDATSVGGTSAGTGNVISGNEGAGIWVGDGAMSNLIAGNRIGTNSSGSAAIANERSGIELDGDSNVVGGTSASARNVISGNIGSGVLIRDQASSNQILGNRIGTNHAGTAAIPNQSGMSVYGDSNVIGDTVAGSLNLISGNLYNGIYVGVDASSNTIAGNWIGVDSSGTVALGNQSGLRIAGDGNALGGTAAGAGNVISGNASSGIDVDDTASGNFISGNRIGTNAAGGAAVPNGGGGVRLYGDSNTIGGITASARNLISGNGFNGISLGVDASSNIVAGNWIGIDVSGTTALANQTGLRILGDDNSLGGTAAGAGNVISGNTSSGIYMDPSASGNTIAGNRIGTNAAGNAAVSNGGGGMRLQGDLNTIGGTTAAARNLVSGNGLFGISLEDGEQNLVQGNYVGVGVDGALAIPNQGYGIRVSGGHDGTIGGTVPGAANIVSGNVRGLALQFEAHDYVVQGNIIGMNAALDAVVWSPGSGIEIRSSGHLVGGTAPGAGNVITGNGNYGVVLSEGATGVRIEGNWIGTDPSGALTAGNGIAGIVVDKAFENTIGGTAPGAGNTIAHSAYLGIYLWSGERNSVLGNSIHSNHLLGIDLEPQGPFPNDALDGDVGANLGQNYPVVTSAQLAGGLAIEGFLASRANTEYRIELFSNDAFDPTGIGEAKFFLGHVDVTTDVTGKATFSTTLPAAGGDAFVTATATDPLGNTSELSPAIAVGAPQPGQLQIWRHEVLSYEGTPGVEVAIVRSHGVQGTVTVEAATVDDSAVAPDDFGAVDDVLSFAPGEVVKSIFVPIVLDEVYESNEKYRVKLTNPGGGAALGAQHDVPAWLFDATLDYPMFTISDAQIVEGDAGSTKLAFQVTVSPTDHDIPVTFWTVEGSAAEGDDYASIEDEILFTPTTLTRTIEIDILGDLATELDEVVYVRIHPEANAVCWKCSGAGRILDDDGGSSDLVFADDFESGDALEWSSAVPTP